MSAGLYYGVDADWWNQWDSWTRIINLLKWIVVGLGCYIATLLLTGLRIKHLTAIQRHQR